MTNNLHFLLHGAPGDCMCSIGHILKHPQFNGQFLYYGLDHSVVPFAQAQPFCSKIVWSKPDSPQEYATSIRTLCVYPRHHPHRKEYRRMIAAREGLKPEELVESQVSMEMKHTMEPAIWKTQCLPKDAEEWADSAVAGSVKPIVLLHPYSFQSNSLDRHWPHWEQALEWFSMMSSDFSFFMTGIGWKYKGNLRRIVDLVGKTPTNNHVLALQKRADLTVATSCNLSHWATCIDKPIINGINMAVTDKRWYFRRCYNFPGAMFVEYNEPMKKMRDLFLEFFGRKR